MALFYVKPEINGTFLCKTRDKWHILCKTLGKWHFKKNKAKKIKKIPGTPRGELPFPTLVRTVINILFTITQFGHTLS